jgi:hypothetical protein
MAEKFRTLEGAYDYAERDNCNCLRIRPTLNGKALESVLISGSNLFHEDGLRDYRAEMTVELTEDSSFGEVRLDRWKELGFDSFGFEKIESGHDRLYRLDLVAANRNDRDGFPNYLQRLGEWLSTGFRKIGLASEDTKLRYEVEVTDKPSFGDRVDWQLFALIDVENCQQELEYEIDASDLFHALYDFLQSVYEAVESLEGADEQDDLVDKFQAAVFDAHNFCNGEKKGYCSDPFLGDEYVESAFELIDNPPDDFCDASDLPREWLEDAFNSNPFLDSTDRSTDYGPGCGENSTTWWTADLDNAKKHLEDLIHAEAGTYRTWASQIRKSVADGETEKWLKT